MKKLLGLLVALAVVFSMSTIAFAADADLGTWDNPAPMEEYEYYTVELAAGNEEGYYFQWTATKEGKLIASISGTVDCNVSLNNQTSGKSDGSESEDEWHMADAGVDVSVGDVVSIQVGTFDPNWGPNPAGEITAMIYVVAVGEYENPEIVEELGDYSVNLPENNEGYCYKWTATGNGKVTVTISSDKDCMVTVTNQTSGKSEGSESGAEPYIAQKSVNVSEYDVVLIQVGTFDPNWGDNPAAKIDMNVTFEAGETDSGEGGEGGGSEEPEKPAYVVDFDVELVVGTNNLTPSTEATNTIYKFSPEQDGIYLFETEEGNLLGYWGGSEFFVFDGTDDKTNSLKGTIEAVGQTLMIGVQATGENCTITVTRIGDRPKTADDFEWNNVAATSKPVSGDKLEGEWNWVNVKDDVKDVAVLGKDGYYHLNSADGPILYLDLSSKRFGLDLVEMNTEGQMRYIEQTGEETWNKVQYKNLFNTYAEAGNVVALTEELVEMLQKVGESKGWYSWNAYFVFQQDEVDADEAWMFACKYIEGHNSMPSIGVDEVPPTADTAMVLMSALTIIMAAAAITVIYTGKKRFA